MVFCCGQGRAVTRLCAAQGSRPGLGRQGRAPPKPPAAGWSAPRLPPPGPFPSRRAGRSGGGRQQRPELSLFLPLQVSPGERQAEAGARAMQLPAAASSPPPPPNRRPQPL